MSAVSRSRSCGTRSPPGMADRFAGCHPLAGTHERLRVRETGSPSRLRGVHLRDRYTRRRTEAAAVCRASGSTPWMPLPVLIDAEAHDRQLAWTSHLPQAVAYALAKCWPIVDWRGVSFGSGAKDTTRLAASNPEMWVDILLQNVRRWSRRWSKPQAGMQELRGLLSDGECSAPLSPAAAPRLSAGYRPVKVAGSVRVPGDKSITHRVLLLAALARGTSRSAARSPRWMPARPPGSATARRRVSPLRPGSGVAGRGPWPAPTARRTLYCGNSGTTTRLTPGTAGGHDFAATLTGDSSLRRRPMRRVTTPLASMGARFTEQNGDGLAAHHPWRLLAAAPLRAAGLERADQERPPACRNGRSGRGQRCASRTAAPAITPSGCSAPSATI